MKKIIDFIEIDSPIEKVWTSIVSQDRYNYWSSSFNPNPDPIANPTYMEGGWRQGESVRFLGKEENGNISGMICEIAENRYLEFISIKALGIIKDGIDCFDTPEAKKWAPNFENYTFKKLGEEKSKMVVETSVDEEYYESFVDMWSDALVKIKEVCEKDLFPFTKVEIETIVDKPLSLVWDYWITPEKIVKWNFASDDWYCPKSTNNFVEKGDFSYTMSSKDDSMKFDFSGRFFEILPFSRIVTQLDDGRMTWVTFEEIEDSKVKVTEIFEAESINNVNLQKLGWQAILDNFKLAVEKEL